MRTINIKILIITLITSFVLYGCSEEDSINRVLTLAGNNRPELEKVLDYFREDSFKYDAARFLIENMESKYYYEGWQIDSLKAIKPFGRMSDEQMAEWKDFDYHKHCRKVDHINVITSRLLIDNIDIACDVWRSRPWHDSYSFDDFCEYVLPYCIGNEPLEEWRSTYYDRYSPIVDSVLLKTTDVVEVAAEIAKKLKLEGFDNHADVALPNLGAKYLMNNRVGFCRENCDIATYAMRSLGIPIATDFYNISPSYNSRHFWSAVIDIDGNAVPFNYTENMISRNNEKDRKMGKVFRYMFGKQKKKYVDAVPSNFPGLFVTPFIKDVSKEYFGHNAPLEINTGINGGWTCLSLFTGNGFVPVDISPMTKGRAVFEYIEEDIIVFPTELVNGIQHPCGFPVLTGVKRHHEFVPDRNSDDTLVIRRKYPVVNTLKQISNMIGGSLSVSNDVNFENNAEVWEFKDTIRGNSVTLNYGSTPVRYIRYRAAADKHIEIAELHVFDKYGKEIPFKNIKADRPLDEVHINNFNLLSDNIWSSFYMSGKGESLIFDLGARVDIGKILFVPRNDDNFIRIGHLYELYYHDGRNGWKSLGIRRADSDSLIYNHVPRNAVFWIHDYTDGIEERCFYNNNGYQQFI